MPYTQDELQNYAFYQQLRNQDIEKYYDKIRNLVNEAAVSRSAVEPLRNSAGTFLSFEEEVNESRIGLSRDTPSEHLPVDQNSPQYRQDISLEKIIARGIASLKEPAKKLGTVPLDPQIEGGPSTVRLRSGMVVSDKDLTEIYYLQNNKKRSFVNNEIFRSYEDVFYPGGMGLTFIIRIKLSSLNAIKNGNNLPFYFSSIGVPDPINETPSTDTEDYDPDTDYDDSGDEWPFNDPQWDPPANPAPGAVYEFDSVNYYWDPSAGGNWVAGT
tara:strand:- start:752 stop:1561 length:810 start_codon:yes stop_codon:yes gene_type:complete